MKPLVEKLKEARKEFRALTTAPTFDEAKVRSIAKGQSDTITELIVAKERMKSRIWGVLTPDQRAKAEKMRESWKAKRMEHEK